MNANEIAKSTIKDAVELIEQLANQNDNLRKLVATYQNQLTEYAAKIEYLQGQLDDAQRRADAMVVKQ